MPLIHKLWDSEILGMKVGELVDVKPTEIYNYSDYDYIVSRAYTSEINICRKLEDDGFRYVDTSITYIHNLDNLNYIPTELIRYAEPKDLERVVEITKNAFYFDRYHVDPLVSKEQADNIYRAWVTNALLGNYGNMIVAENSGTISGFTSFRTFEVDGWLVGTIDLTALGNILNYGNSSISDELVQWCLNYFKEKSCFHVSTATQVGNYSSRQSLERNGFIPLDMYIWFSKGKSNG